MANVVKSKVANALTSAAKDHVIAVAQDIYDEELNQYQSEINKNKADLVDGKVPSTQLPSYVDDVLEGYYKDSVFYKTKSGSTYSDAYTGESGKIYVDVDTNKSYRWSGTAYVEISSSLALGETSSTAYRGDRGKTAYDHSQSAHAPSNAQANTIETVKVNGTALTPDANKAVNITVPSVSGKEDTSNKVTSWSATTTNTHYPSEKLVKDSLDAKQAALTQGTDIVINGTTISAKNTVKQLGYLTDLNVDVSTIDGDFAVFFTDDAADNKPAEWTAGGLYATGLVYKPANSNNSEWIQVCWRTTSDGSNMYSRYKNPGQAWSQWYCVDDNNKVGIIGSITDANIDCSNLKYNLYTFTTGNTCANTPWTGVESAIQATGLLFKKGTGVWQQLIWRAGVKGILYTRYYNSSGWPKEAIADTDPVQYKYLWYRLDSGYTNIGEVNTLNINPRGIETDFAGFIVKSFEDDSSPWGDEIGAAVNVLCQYQKIGRDWYQKVWRMWPLNAGVYMRKCNIDDPYFQHADIWRRIDASPTGAPVTSVNTKTGAVVLSANDVNAVSTVANQGLTDTQKSNARTNIGASAIGHTHGDLYLAKKIFTTTNSGTAQTGKWREVAVTTNISTSEYSNATVFAVKDSICWNGDYCGLLSVSIRCSNNNNVTHLTLTTDNPNLKDKFITVYNNTTHKWSLYADASDSDNTWILTCLTDNTYLVQGDNVLVNKPTAPTSGMLAECVCYVGGSLDGYATEEWVENKGYVTTDRTTITVGGTNLTGNSGSTRNGITLAAGSNVTLTPDATNNKVTISASDSSRIHNWSVGGVNVVCKLFSFQIPKERWGNGSAEFSYASRNSGVGSFRFSYSEIIGTETVFNIKTYYTVNSQLYNSYVPSLYLTTTSTHYVVTCYAHIEQYSTLQMQQLSLFMSEAITWTTEVVNETPTGTLVQQDFGSVGNVTSVNTKTGAVVLSASDVNAVSTVASQGLTDTQKSNARTNIGAGTSNLTIGTTATTAAAGNHTHSNYLTGITKSMVTTALGYTPPTSDTWRPIGTGETDAAAGNHTHSSYVAKSGDDMTGSLTMKGSDLVLGTSGTSSNDSGDIIWKYGNGNEKARLYVANTYDAEYTPAYRVFKEDGTKLKEGALAWRDHTHSGMVTNTINNLTAKNYLNWGTAANNSIPTTSTIAYWNGAYNSTGTSNLTYCNKGAFGTMATKDNISDYLSSSITSTDGTKAATSSAVKTVNDKVEARSVKRSYSTGNLAYNTYNGKYVLLATLTSKNWTDITTYKFLIGWATVSSTNPIISGILSVNFSGTGGVECPYYTIDQALADKIYCSYDSSHIYIYTKVSSTCAVNISMFDDAGKWMIGSDIRHEIAFPTSITSATTMTGTASNRYMPVPDQVILTQAQYNALSTKNPNTLYFIKE